MYDTLTLDKRQAQPTPTFNEAIDRPRVHFPVQSNKKQTKALQSKEVRPSVPLFGETVETEMVTLERVEAQKKFLLDSCYFKKPGCTADGLPVLKSHSFVL